MERAFRESLFAIAPRRASYRSYRSAPEQAERVAALDGAIAVLPPAPFGTPIRIALIRDFDPQAHGVEKLGTYGVIRGATSFLVGLMPRGPRSFEDLGYVFEWVILQATELGLQTCWVGGTLDRGAFARAARASATETVPVVSPVGVAAEKRSLIDRTFRLFAGSKDRKPWRDLFFTRDFATPMPEAQDAPFQRALALVRLGPSASNQQPWRVLYDPDRAALHFYLARTRGYQKLMDVDLQRVDLGIAMCHFGFGCRELGVDGTWTGEAPAGPSPPPGLEHVATFQAAGR
jgi:nitroreductase